MSVADLEPTRERLGTHTLGRSLVLLPSTPSTMDDARAALAAGAAEGQVIVADQQTSGRGTHGRPWSSPAGTDLYLSFITRPRVPLERLPTMALAVGLGVGRAVSAFVDPERVRLKWPNDVLVDGAKVAGVLVETRATSDGIEGVIVGIGINCNRRTFDANSSEVDGDTRTGERIAPISLALAAGADFDRATVLARVLQEIESALDTWAREPLANTLAAIEARLAYRGEVVRLDVRDAEGTLLGLSPEGGLRLATVAGERVFQAGRLSRVTEVTSGEASA